MRARLRGPELAAMTEPSECALARCAARPPRPSLPSVLPDPLVEKERRRQ